MLHTLDEYLALKLPGFPVIRWACPAGQVTIDLCRSITKSFYHICLASLDSMVWQSLFTLWIQFGSPICGKVSTIDTFRHNSPVFLDFRFKPFVASCSGSLAGRTVVANTNLWSSSMAICCLNPLMVRELDLRPWRISLSVIEMRLSAETPSIILEPHQDLVRYFEKGLSPTEIMLLLGIDFPLRTPVVCLTTDVLLQHLAVIY